MGGILKLEWEGRGVKMTWLRSMHEEARGKSGLAGFECAAVAAGLSLFFDGPSAASV